MAHISICYICVGHDTNGRRGDEWIFQLLLHWHGTTPICISSHDTRRSTNQGQVAKEFPFSDIFVYFFIFHKT